jgi:hypothetical protein
MSDAFTYIGIAVCALGGGALVVICGYVITLKLRGGYHLCLRRWQVIDALAQTPKGAWKAEDGEDTTIGARFTFAGARRLAKRTTGTRIFNAYDWSFAIVRRGWSESENGFPGYYINAGQAAKLLGIAPDDEPGPGRYDSARRVLDAGKVRIDADDYGSFVFNTQDVMALASKRQVLAA